jgi:hypothetical protein
MGLEVDYVHNLINHAIHYTLMGATISGASMLKITISSLLLLSVLGCASRCQRFVPVEHGIVLDTKTGRYCDPVKEGPSALPYCYDLYKE